jgi:hypothetical protein
MIENGFAHLAKEAAWLAEYLHELTAFPRGRHDDHVDSTTHMLDWLKQAGVEPQHWVTIVSTAAAGPGGARSAARAAEIEQR